MSSTSSTQNRSVTQKEYVLKDDVIIVSQTDLKGNIIQANESFIEASGYDWSELVGQPHNVLRHPDVPAAVFKDFWATLQAGKPWSQVVKNRRKNGDHYWVIANATPLFKDGKVAGYMSVRTPATRQQISEAEEAYRQIAAGKVHLTGGEIRSTWEKINPINNINMIYQLYIFASMVLIFGSMNYFYPDVAPGLFTVLHALAIITMVGMMAYNFNKLRHIFDLVTSVSEGHFDNHISIKGRTLFDQILGRIKAMQIRLGAELDDTKSLLTDAKRVESALDASSACIMVADRFRSIIYVNKATQALMQKLAPELKTLLPNFNPDKLLRQSIDEFHQQPDHQAQQIANLTSTHTARIHLGKSTIELMMDPIFNDQQQRIGTVVEWRDLTLQLAIEENINAVVGSASDGVLSERLNLQGLNGFNLNLSQNMNHLLENFHAVMQEMQQVLTRMSQGDLTVRLNMKLQGDVAVVETAINEALSNIEQTFLQIKQGTLTIGNMSSEVAEASADLSQRTQVQAAALEQVAASVTQLNSNIAQTNANTSQVTHLASEAVKGAEEGIEVMGKTSQAMSGISALSQKIGEITSVIDSIAFQTNLLALNAAVEAARAGEHGRGFAVVASEVRNLAQKSAESSKEISSLIGSTIQQINLGAGLVENTHEVFSNMVTKIQQVNDLVLEVNQATEQQTKGLGQINATMRSLDGSTQQNAALVEELSATAGNMSEQADEQAAAVERFKLSTGLLALSR
ncbi:methyl-accepting chemotaxis protein [Thiosulfativibrio zosterae]|uniref:Methyl-accepting chemotaxis protein n=1 Tax=Thiosulfativibrio zosterae TaxID=2675053 RepID=A0A6F8PQS8_9GAMM|nr:methyl-accepting chemotaxis protein [Thiosulfativibrio zosterae]BBP44394.1 hypothetical protein THMIRHAT_21400 [Thiosulfativibrio zosterae]